MFLSISKERISKANNKPRWIIISMIFICAVIFSLKIGVEELTIKDLFSATSGSSKLLIISRIPRTLTLLLTGAGLAVAGVIMQQLTRNKFLAPSTAGTLDAAKLGILMGLLFFPHLGMLPKLGIGLLVCFALTSFFTFSVAEIVKKDSLLIPVFGVMYGYVLNALTTMLGVHFNIIQNMEGWLIGNFAKSLQGQYELIFLLIPIVVISYNYAHRFTILGMGKSFTLNLGINYRFFMGLGILLTAITVSTTVLLVGSIPFIDLVVPNLVSLFHGDNMHKNLPFTAVYGAISLLLCDSIARLIIYPYEMPASMIIGSLGALVFLIILLKKGR